MKAPAPAKRASSRTTSTKATLRLTTRVTSGLSASIAPYFHPIAACVADANANVITATQPTHPTSPLASVEAYIIEALSKPTGDLRTIRRLNRTLARRYGHSSSTLCTKPTPPPKGKSPTVLPSASHAKPVRSVADQHWVPPGPRRIL